MGNFKVCLVVVLATLLPSYIKLQHTDPCIVVQCADGYDCVASYDDCKYDDIHDCTATPKCVSRTTTEGTTSGIICTPWPDPCETLECQFGSRCLLFWPPCVNCVCPKPDAVCMTEDEGRRPESTTPCSYVTCDADQDCLESYVDCVSYPCEPIVKCIPRINKATDLEFEEDTGTFEACNLMCLIGNRCIIKDGKAQCVPGAPSVTPASSWEDPCSSFICKEGEECFAMYHTCETGTCPPTPVCVPTFEEAKEGDVSESPTVTPASSWEDPCNLMDCKDGEKCYHLYHTCETGTCPPTAVCGPTFEEVEENDEDPPVTSASSWEDPCNLIDCRDGESCQTVFHTCETGTTCPPSGVCVPMFYDTESLTQCSDFGDEGKLCEADCSESEECRCVTPPNTYCFVGPCLFPTCIDKNEYATTSDNPNTV